MKLNQIILPIVGLGLAGLVLVPAAMDAQAYSLTGSSLGQGQRDFRIFNNFSGTSDNNNQVPDDNFPGYQGADMAIWKGCVEWGSTAHGTGAGDPSQGILGSGGANFDPSFQGNATAIGTTNSNVHSEISGSNGGVLAYTEIPSSDGWRIRYYGGWVWSDGPGSPGGGSAIDLQEVACHEYGHAVGLGHSTFGAATMYPSYSGGISGRSIHSDDQAGTQAVYGTINPLKPTITSLTITGSQITLTGINYSPTDNQVWFTQAASGGNGTPIKVTNVNSNGTSITVTIPAAAGPGDVLVRKNGTGNAGLSNTWPTDLLPGGGGCNAPVNYCSSLPNSGSAGAQITFSNLPSISTNNFELVAFGMPANKPGLFFYGPNQQGVLFGEGLLCVGGQIQRLATLQTDSFGFVNQVLDFNSAPFNSGSGAVSPGQTENFQFWFRDPSFGPNGFNTTDGLQVTFCD